MIGQFVHAASKKNGEHELISGKLISQYSSYSAMFVRLHSIISKEYNS